MHFKFPSFSKRKWRVIQAAVATFKYSDPLPGKICNAYRTSEFNSVHLTEKYMMF